MNLLNNYFFSQFSVFQQLCCHFSSWILPSDVTSCTTLFRNSRFGQQTKVIHNSVCPASNAAKGPDVQAVRVTWWLKLLCLRQGPRWMLDTCRGALQSFTCEREQSSWPCTKWASPNGWAPCKAPGRTPVVWFWWVSLEKKTAEFREELQQGLVVWKMSFALKNQRNLI